MTPEHAHLILNHTPIFAGLFGAALLLWGLWRRSRDLSRAGLALILVAGVAAGPVYLSGRSAEERVEHLPGVSEEILEEHEDAGLWALVTAAIAGALAAIGLGLSRRARPVPPWIGAAALAAALMAGGVLARTAYLGGQVRHSEIRPGAQAPGVITGDPDTSHAERGDPD